MEYRSNNIFYLGSPVSTTVYTVSGNLTGCASVATKTVSVNVVSNPTVTVSNATICAGASANLSASGATSYAWNTGATTASITVTPTTTTNYTVTGLNAAGCSNSKVVNVSVNALPNVAASSATICLGGSTNLIASGASSYTHGILVRLDPVLMFLQHQIQLIQLLELLQLVV